MHTTTTTRVLDVVTNGELRVADGIVYLLTTCCGASAKGGEHGVICRACYAPIDERFGMAWMAADFEAAYPAWMASVGLTEGTPDVFAHLSRVIARDLGIA